MRIIYVDNDKQEIKRFEETIRQIEGIGDIQTFSESLPALDFIRHQKADIVFLSVQMHGMNGITLAKRMAEIQSDIHVVFLASDDTYALQAFQVNAVGYLLRPYTVKGLEEQIERVKKLFHIRQKRKVYFQTIPRFEVFVDDHLLPISKKKVKEYLALLVDFAGCSVTSEQAITYLWEDRPDDDTTKALLRMTAKRLRDVLMQEKIDFLLIEENGVRAIDTKTVSCDYYQILDGDYSAMRKYQGEYMVEYSWAEMTNARLNRMLFHSRKA